MNFSNNLNELIPIIAFGSLLIAALYHSNLYLFNRTDLLKTYSIYLWLCLAFLFTDIFIFEGSLDKINLAPELYKNLLLPFLFRSATLWLSFNYYLKLLLVSTEFENSSNKYVLYISKYFWTLLPIYIICHFPSMFVAKENYVIFKIFFGVFNFIALSIAIYFWIVIFKHYQNIKKNSENSYLIYIILGGLSLLVFMFFTIIATLQQDILLLLNYLSYIAIGYFIEIFFFSMGISLKMRSDALSKYLALKKLRAQEIQLQSEIKKASTILDNQEIILENERNKAIAIQKNIIGRKLHDHLSGSLVALKYLINDYKNTSKSVEDIGKMKSIEEELEVIYKETRDFSHYLSKSTEVEKEHIFDIKQYLQKLSSQFNELEFHKVFYEIDEIGMKQLTNNQINSLYYCIKECFSNSLKHAQSKNIQIKIYFELNICHLEIIDDGIGLQKRQIDGIGVNNINYNVNMLNGDIDMHSDETGTKVKIYFPV